MSDSLTDIIKHLESVQQLNQSVQENNLSDTLAQLQHWQCQRLLATHDDLWSQKRFKPAMQFFIDELYGPKDFSQRDADIARVVPKMATLLPEKALSSLASALHLNSLSLEMDLAMVKQLNGQTVTRDSYAQAYRDCDNQAQRSLQIDFIEELGDTLAEVVKIKGISALLMVSRGPAKVAGLLSLHEFLEQGYKAFRKLGKVEEFIDPIVRHERELMLALFEQRDVNPLPEGL